MNFLGLGPAEIVLVMLLALIVFGPGKLPEIGQGLGRAIRQFRAASSEITEEFNREFNIEKMLQDPPKQQPAAAAPASAAPLSQAAATIASAAAAAPAESAPDQSVAPVASDAVTPARPVITVAGDGETAAEIAPEPATTAVESAGPVAPDPLPAEYPYGEIVSRADATLEAPRKPVEDAPEAVAEPKMTEETGV